MKRFSLLLAMLFAFSALPAQTIATGAYAFGTFDNHGFDSINVGNMNVRFSIPVVSRIGRGIPFNYALQYEGLVWSLSADGTTWVADPSWGFSGALNGSPLVGYLSYITGYSPCPRPPNYSGHVPPANAYSNFVYHDASGVNHSFNYSVAEPCPLTGGGQITGDGNARDNSGLTLLDMNTIKTLAGTVINPAIQPASQGNATITDPNGNQITVNGNTFVDTTGVTALTVGGSGTASSPRTYSYPTTTQAQGIVTVTYVTYPIQTAFGCPNVSDVGVSTPLSADLVDHIVLADGVSTYRFAYEATPGATNGAVTARLASVTLPGGGKIGYTYTGNNNGVFCGEGSPAGITRTMLSDSPNTSWTYSRSYTGSHSHTYVVDGLGNSSDYDFVAATVQSGAQQPISNYYEVNRNKWNGGTNTQHIFTQATCYNNSGSFCIDTAISNPVTQLDAFTTMNETQMNGSTTYLNSSGLQTEIDSYDYGPSQFNESNARGGLLRKELLTYGGCNGFSSSLSSDVVQDGVGNTLSQSTYCYDETTPAATSNVPNHTSVNGPRGNLTTATVYTNSSNTRMTTNTYADTGTVLSSTSKVNGTAIATTQFGYDPTYTFQTSTTLPTPSSGVSMSTSAGYDTAQSGMPLSSTDVNSQPTSVRSYDAMLRPNEIDYPDQGKNTFSYTPNNVSAQVYQSASVFSDVETQLDAYGRVVRSAVQNDSNQWYMQDTCYDANGNTAFVSYRYASGNLNAGKVCSGSGDAYQYDVLNRVRKIQHADWNNSYVQYNYQGRSTQVIDENGKQRISQVDGLGRPTYICEVTSATMGTDTPGGCGLDIAGTGFLTAYSYAYEGGGPKATISQGLQTRVFDTDWTGRPTYTSEPERGVTTYGYSANSTGEVSVRSRPSANQTNASNTTNTTTQYDLLGRPLTISYSDGTAEKYYNYDAQGGWAQAQTNVKGRLQKVFSSIAGNLAASIFSYDPVGRVNFVGQCVPSGCFNASRDIYVPYNYDLAGNLTSAGNGVFGTTGYQYTRAGEVKLVTNITNDAMHPANLAANFTQSANGPMSFQYGNGLYGVRNYDPVGRLAQGWTCSGTASPYCQDGTPLHQWGITPQGSQTVRACDDSLGPCATIGYDDLNRMSSRTPDSGTALSNTWTYDRYGNRLTQTSGQGFNVTTTFNTLNNQDSNYTYDAAGNVTYDPGTGNSFKFDAEGNIIEVDHGSTVVATYYYNALNQRVRAVNQGKPFEFVFDQWNRRLAVLNGSNGAGITILLYSPSNGNAPMAFDLNAQTHFEHQDWTGTERLRTTYNGGIEGKYSSQPFGDALTTTQGSDQEQYHYAELDRDYESGLDHAQFRHYNSAHGHWMSPDPFGGSYDLSDPQSLNRYVYSLNRPLSLHDRSGMAATCSTEDDYATQNCEDAGGGGGCAVDSCVTTTLPPGLDPVDFCSEFPAECGFGIQPVQPPQTPPGVAGASNPPAPNNPQRLTCTGTAYVLAGNPANVGQTGFPNTTVTNGSAAVIPRQFTGQFAGGPFMRQIGASTFGTVTGPNGATESFNTITQAVGNAALGTALQAQNIIMGRDPGALVIEIVGGTNTWKNAAVTINMPALGQGCPAGTSIPAPPHS